VARRVKCKSICWGSPRAAEALVVHRRNDEDKKGGAPFEHPTFGDQVLSQSSALETISPALYKNAPGH
jgi:hypothetical protein